MVRVVLRDLIGFLTSSLDKLICFVYYVDDHKTLRELTSTLSPFPFVRCDASKHVVSFPQQGRGVKLTPTEYRIFQLFTAQVLLSDEILAQTIFGCVSDGSIKVALEKHVDHLRSKIRVYGLDIRRVLRYGYVLLKLEGETHGCG